MGLPLRELGKPPGLHAFAVAVGSAAAAPPSRLAQLSRPPWTVLICPHCTRSLTADAKFCSGCGTALPRLACLACHAINAVESAFCEACGAALHPAVEAQKVEPVAAAAEPAGAAAEAIAPMTVLVAATADPIAAMAGPVAAMAELGRSSRAWRGGARARRANG
ncbi:MAG: zinc ribbon domain-containing protein [Rubrivivax sp.]